MIGKSSLGTTIKLVVVASSKIEYNLAIKMRTSWACSHGWIASPAQRKTCLQAQKYILKLVCGTGSKLMPNSHTAACHPQSNFRRRSNHFGAGHVSSYITLPRGDITLLRGDFTCIPHASQITRGDSSGTPGLSTRSEGGTQEPSTIPITTTRKTLFMGHQLAPATCRTPEKS